MADYDIDIERYESGEPTLVMSIPKSIPLGIVMAIVIQIGAVIWAVSSYYKENELMQQAISQQFQALQDEISSIKGSIYTRQEALVLEKRIDTMEDRVMFLEHQGYKDGRTTSSEKPKQ